MNREAFQDAWPEGASHCFGCGRNNDHGLQIKSYWDGDEAICIWQPQEQYKAGEDILNGGIIATLIDCHSLNTANAAASRAEGGRPIISYVTRNLRIDLLQPTPITQSVTLRARIKEFSEKKITLTCSLFSGKNECASGEIVAVRLPEELWIK